MELHQEQQAEKEKTRMKFRRVFDRNPITHIKDRVRYDRSQDKGDLMELVEEYFEEQAGG